MLSTQSNSSYMLPTQLYSSRSNKSSDIKSFYSQSTMNNHPQSNEKSLLQSTDESYFHSPEIYSSDFSSSFYSSKNSFLHRASIDSSSSSLPDSVTDSLPDSITDSLSDSITEPFSDSITNNLSNSFTNNLSELTKDTFSIKDTFNNHPFPDLITDPSSLSSPLASNSIYYSLPESPIVPSNHLLLSHSPSNSNDSSTNNNLTDLSTKLDPFFSLVYLQSIPLMPTIQNSADLPSPQHDDDDDIEQYINFEMFDKISDNHSKDSLTDFDKEKHLKVIEKKTTIKDNKSEIFSVPTTTLHHNKLKHQKNKIFLQKSPTSSKSQKIPCIYTDCSKLFGRKSDLERHVKSVHLKSE
ncbi:hypothetical protein HK099_003162, partial [Clydaea vesicula]